MSKIFLLRHLKSQWNLDDRFAGWCDNPLSKEGADMAKTIAESMQGQTFDVVYTSPLIRNMQTVIKILRNINNSDKYPFFIHLDGGKMQKWGDFTDISENDLTTYVSENLNERYYGKLQGLNKKETIEKYGEEKVHLWRRSYDVAPPGGESEKDVYKRVYPFYKKYIEKDLKDGKNILVVSSHNSLRAIVKYIENISDDKISEVELPFGALVKYEFNGKDYVKLQ
jgi:2,3-bisphosphoglycerate-dependent phosphoglycerate mutase